MKSSINSMLLLFLCFLATPCIAQSGKNMFLPLNASRLRALGLAGALQATRDDLASISYNPANYSLYRESKTFRVTLFFAPFTSALAGLYPDKFLGRAAQRNEGYYVAAASFLKGLDITFGSLNAGFLFGEPVFNFTRSQNETSGFHVNSLYSNHYNSFILRLKLADQVAIGASASLVYLQPEGSGRRWSLAASYGIAMQPNDHIRVGLSLLSASTEILHYREFLDEMYSDALNLGISVRMPGHFLLNFDLRNLTVTQEIQDEKYLLGLEKSFWKQLAVRAGVQFDPQDGFYTYSFGVGLLNFNKFYSDSRAFTHENYALNYVFIRRLVGSRFHSIHGLNFYIRF